MSINTYAVIVFIVALLITTIGFFITMHKSFDFTYLLIAGAISMIIIITFGIVEVGINSSLVSSKKMSYISLQEINKISPNNNSATLFNVTYTDTEDIDRKITVKEIAYDSDTTYIEKTRKTFLFLYEDNYVLHEPQKFINNNN